MKDRSDRIVASGKWEFNELVSDCFDDMLFRSIPDYTAMRDLTWDVGKHFVKPDSKILDMGCSNGSSIVEFVEYCDKQNFRYGWNTKCVGIDCSQPMVEKAKERFKLFNCVEISNCDILTAFPKDKYDLILSILTIQFTPLEYRHEIIQKVYNALNSGGAFIFVEKLLCKDADMNTFFVDRYYDIKRRNGYTEEQIQAKKESLKGVLVPLTDEWNRGMLESVGFRKVECFWRCYNFAAYLCVKD